MMNIGEFAKRTGLSPSAIRFYGDRGLLPAASVDSSSGYRSYTDDQIEVAITIRALRLMEMSLVEIGSFIDLPGDERRPALEHKIAQLEQTVHQARAIAEQFGGNTPSEETNMSTSPTLTMPARDLSRALEQVLPASGTSPDRPHLMSVLIESKDGSVRIAATDSHRLAVRDVHPIADDEAFSATIAAATAATWIEQLGETSAVSMVTDGHRVTVEHGGDVWSAALIPMTFPDYEAVLTRAVGRSAVVVNRQSMLDALERFTGDDGGVDLALSTNGFVLQRGDTSIAVAGECDGVDRRVEINPRYLRDAITHSVGLDVVIELGEPLDTIVCRSADDGTFTTMIMPIRPDGAG